MRRRVATFSLALALAACGTVQPARIGVPDELIGNSETVEVHGLGSARQGAADVMGRSLRFERSASRLAWFDDFSVRNRAALRFSLADGTGGASSASCSVSRRTMAIGHIEWVPKPLVVTCDFSPSKVRLELHERRPGLSGHKVERRGRLLIGERSLDVRSVHRAKGALFELPNPIGYLIADNGRAVGAVEINGRTPRLQLPLADPELREASLHALLALALMWDAADG